MYYKLGSNIGSAFQRRLTASGLLYFLYNTSFTKRSGATYGRQQWKRLVTTQNLLYRTSGSEFKLETSAQAIISFRIKRDLNSVSRSKSNRRIIGFRAVASSLKTITTACIIPNLMTTNPGLVKTTFAQSQHITTFRLSDCKGPYSLLTR